MAQSIWNPDEQFDLDDETGLYDQQPAATPMQIQPQYDPDKLNQLAQKAGGMDQAMDWLARNPGDLDRGLTASWGNNNNAQAATSQYSGGNPTAAGAGDAQLSQYLQMLQQRDQQQQQQQAQLREILMGQLGQASQPVSVNAPGIREVLAGGRIGLQRGAERERKNAAEMRAYDGSGGLGGKAFDSDVSGILQRQGESEARMTGDVLGKELQGKRDQLNRLLTLAMSLGDSESARTIQQQLNAIQTQLQQSNFYDTTAFNYAGLNQAGNQAALMALLGAF